MALSSQDETAFNRAAKLVPMTGTDGKPAIEVAGALVFAYVDGGTLRVSIDLDTITPALTHGDEMWVPVQVTCQGQTVWEAGQP